MCIKRENKQHMKGYMKEKHTSIIYKRKQVQCMTINGHKTSCTRINVSNKERKEKIHNILTTSLKKINTPPNTMIPKTNSPPKNDYSHI